MTATKAAAAASSGMATRSHGAKSGVRASSPTASQAVASTATTVAATPVHESFAQRTSSTVPAPASTATAGASALT